MSKPVVYIASPYTKGDPAINVHFQCQAFNKILSDGVVWPVAPLWTHFQHTLFPRPYEDWIEYDLALLSRYDACLRLDSRLESLDYLVTESSGADGEAVAFGRMGKPVFYSLISCYQWARGECKS